MTSPVTHPQRLRNANVTPNFTSQTACNACNAFLHTGSYIRENTGPLEHISTLYKRHTPKLKTGVTALHALQDAKNDAPYALHEALQTPISPERSLS